MYNNCLSHDEYRCIPILLPPSALSIFQGLTAVNHPPTSLPVLCIFSSHTNYPFPILLMWKYTAFLLLLSPCIIIIVGVKIVKTVLVLVLATWLLLTSSIRNF